MTKIEKVKKYIIEGINNNILLGGDKLPSCRKMSAKFAVNKITVNKAYKELENDHIVYCIPRGGFYVVDSLDAVSTQSEEINFRDIKPDRQLIPYREFNHSINVAVNLFKRDAFNYNSPSGLSSLRHLLKNTFEEDGIYTQHNQIIITNGAQQAIALSLETILKVKPGKLLVENPTYDLVLDFIDHKNLDTVFIDRNENRYDVKMLESIFKYECISAFYIIPRYHNPTGYSLSEVAKKMVVALANKYNVIIIEDDYLGDLGNKQSLPIHYYDIYDQTIYIRSFSKTFMPGIRLGVAVLPEYLVDTFTKIKKLNDLNTSTITQVSLETFIKSGMYTKQVRKVKECYKDKLQKAKNIISSLNPSHISCYIPDQGIFIWVCIKNHIDYSYVDSELAKQGFLVKRGDVFWSDKKQAPDKYIRLCLSGVSKEDIDKISTLILSINKLAINNC